MLNSCTNSKYVVHDCLIWDRECMHIGGPRPVVRGPHKVGIRAILTLGDLSLAWALASTPIKANYGDKDKECGYIYQ